MNSNHTDTNNFNMSSLASNNPFREPVPSKNPDVHLTAHEENEEYDPSTSPIPPQTPERGSCESSPTRSDYGTDADVLNTGNTKTAVKVFDIYNTSSRLDLKIFDPATNTCIFYVENSTLSPKKPDVLLFQGSAKQGCPITAVARWKSMLSKTVDFGIGDPGAHFENAPSIPWETMTAEKSLKMNDHRFNIPGDISAKTYMWRRTHNEGVDKEHNSLSSNNFKLLDTETDEILATFANNRYKSWKKFGKLTFRRDLGAQFEVVALVTCLALVEKGRRRARMRRGPGGASVGGG